MADAFFLGMEIVPAQKAQDILLNDIKGKLQGSGNWMLAWDNEVSPESFFSFPQNTS